MATRRLAGLARAALAAVALAAALAGALAGAGRPAALAVAAAAAADDDWLAEFEATCSRTQDAMSLPSDELRALVVRCDRLRPRIEALDPSRRKVFQRRLQLCRELYQFVLDSRTQG